MTLQAFETLIKTADPTATHYVGTGVGDYTSWAEYGDEADGADDKRVKLFDRIQVDHYTKVQYAPMKETISNVLDSAGITYRYTCRYDADQNGSTGYIHHMWDCEVY